MSLRPRGSLMVMSNRLSSSTIIRSSSWIFATFFSSFIGLFLTIHYRETQRKEHRKYPMLLTVRSAARNTVVNASTLLKNNWYGSCKTERINDAHVKTAVQFNDDKIVFLHFHQLLVVVHLFILSFIH